MTHCLPFLRIQHQTLYCQGDWIVAHDLNPLLQQFKTLSIPEKNLVINTEKLSTLDSVGAWILNQLTKKLEKQGKTLTWINLKPEQASLLTLIDTQQ